ncbi:MAG: cupin domain-containing protein [Chloroflexi bacterium]|nr:cupin domain-containing protein [Chloroflexota bacterium]
MRGSKKDLPIAFEGDGFVSQQTEWGGLNVAIEKLPAGLDATDVFKGLPDDRCQCPHWGYVLKGRIRIKYHDREEVFNAGDAYYMAAGHIPFVEEESELVEFSPKGEYQKTMEVVARNMAALQAKPKGFTVR